MACSSCSRLSPTPVQCTVYTANWRPFMFLTTPDRTGLDIPIPLVEEYLKYHEDVHKTVQSISKLLIKESRFGVSSYSANKGGAAHSPPGTACSKRGWRRPYTLFAPLRATCNAQSKKQKKIWTKQRWNGWIRSASSNSGGSTHGCCHQKFVTRTTTTTATNEEEPLSVNINENQSQPYSQNLNLTNSHCAKVNISSSNIFSLVATNTSSLTAWALTSD